MPTIKVYRHGVTMGSGNPHAKPPERTACQGWSSSAIRRNLKFLYGVNENELTGRGFAFTLTVKSCPSSADWVAMRDNWIREQRRSGMLRMHWVTEWQRRGVPHLHCAVWYGDREESPDREGLADWLRLAEPYGAKRKSQNVHEIYDPLGWNQYVSKHAARGLHHYQRSPENVPQSWKGASSGRMWGKVTSNGGGWPVQSETPFEVSREEFWRVRRVVRAWRLSEARRPQMLRVEGVSGIYAPWVDSRRVSVARGMLRCPVRALSAVRGCSVWMGEDLMVPVVGWAGIEPEEWNPRRGGSFRDWSRTVGRV